MIDAREQVKELLLTICDNVKMTKPSGDVRFPLICYAETGNAHINIAYDRLKYSVAVYAGTFEELISLTDAVNTAMVNFGFTRTNVSPDTEARKGTDFYLKRIDYSCMINKERNTIIKQTT